MLHLDALANCLWWLLCLILVRRLARRLWGQSEAIWASCLFGFSSCFWMSAWSDFPHLQTTALGLLCWDTFQRYLTENAYVRPRAVLILSCWMAVGATRIQDLPIVLAVPTTWLLMGAAGRLKVRLKQGIALLGLGCLSCAAALALINSAQTGDPLLLPFILLHGRQIQLEPHSLGRANMDENLKLQLTPFPQGAGAFDSQAYHQAACNYMATSQDRQRALQCLLKSLPSPHPAMTYTFMGYLQHDLGLLAEAAQSLRQALQYDPADTATREEYLSILKELNRK